METQPILSDILARRPKNRSLPDGRTLILTVQWKEITFRPVMKVARRPVPAVVSVGVEHGGVTHPGR